MDLLVARHVENDVDSQAIYSPCKTYRYSLVRRFGKPPATRAQRIAFIGLNPSTATERVNDPTVRRCIGYARDWGFREFVMLNAFGLRSTNPQGLKKVSDPNGPGNDEQISRWVRKCSHVICCWGVHAAYLERDTELRNLLRRLKVRALCLGTTQAGYPRHPLYLRKDLQPVPFV